MKRKTVPQIVIPAHAGIHLLCAVWTPAPY